LPHCCEHHLRGGPFDCAVATLPLRFRPQLVDTTTLLHTFRLLARIFVIGSFAVVFLVLASLLHGELAKASAAEIWRMLKRDTAETKSQ